MHEMALRHSPILLTLHTPNTAIQVRISNLFTMPLLLPATVMRFCFPPSHLCTYASHLALLCAYTHQDPAPCTSSPPALQ
mmetsp:Transcript_17776/g.44101  ORF Transcript_17776/g.44101 Transcript_17776/m.44101 type:complete len:80 (-) Transcript_17776:244-483(-)